MKTISKTSVLFMAVESAINFKRETRETANAYSSDAYILAVKNYGQAMADEMVEQCCRKEIIKISSSQLGLKALSRFDDGQAITKQVDKLVLLAVLAGLQGKRIDASIYTEVKQLYWGIESVRSRILHGTVIAKLHKSAVDAFDASKQAIEFESRPLHHDELIDKMIAHDGYIEVALELCSSNLLAILNKLKDLVTIPDGIGGFVHPETAILGNYYQDGKTVLIQNESDLDGIISDKERQYIDSVNLNPNDEGSSLAWD